MTLDQRRALVDTIAGRCAELGVDELRVLDRIAARLQMGQRQYGELRIDSDARDMVEEMAQELFDASVYAAVAIEQLKRLVAEIKGAR